MKRVIRLGDPTSHGGKVVSAASPTFINGIQVARLGDKVTCPRKGHGTGTIVEADPEWFLEGIPVVLEGHHTSCGASLISTLSSLGRSYEGTGSASSAELTADAPFETGLGADVNKLAAKSPTLQGDLEKLDKEKWTIERGPSGEGSRTIRSKKTITIDGALTPRESTQALAHEVGHAAYPFQPDYSSKESFVKGMLDDEGAATLNNVKVRREIIANHGPDIELPGNRENHAFYNRAYDQFLQDGDAAAARRSIGSVFAKGEVTSGSKVLYADHYGNWYDKVYAPKN